MFCDNLNCTGITNSVWEVYSGVYYIQYVLFPVSYLRMLYNMANTILGKQRSWYGIYQQILLGFFRNFFFVVQKYFFVLNLHCTVIFHFVSRHRCHVCTTQQVSKILGWLQICKKRILCLWYFDFNCIYRSDVEKLHTCRSVSKMWCWIIFSQR